MRAWTMAFSQSLLQSGEARYWAMLVVLSALNMIGFVLLVGRLWHLECHAAARSTPIPVAPTANPLLIHTDVAAFLDDAKTVFATSPIVHAADVAQEIRLPLLQHRY